MITAIVDMIMMVCIERQAWFNMLAKEFYIGGVFTDRFRVAMATNMIIHTHHGIGSRHHQVQVMGYHEYSAIKAFRYILNKLVKLGLPSDIDPLDRFVEH